MPPIGDKPLPQNADAEKSVLGSILLENSHLKAAAERISSGDFFFRPNALIYSEILTMRDAGIGIDLLTLTDWLQQKSLLERVGGAAYVASLVDGIPRLSNVGHYADIIREKAQLRTIITQASTLQQRAMSGLASPAELAIDLELMAKASSSGHHHRPKLQPITLEEFLMMDLKPVEFVISPILPVQGLALIYAWRGVGKTNFNLELGVAIATADGSGKTPCFAWTVPKARRVLYVDGEMPANELQDRLRGICMGRGMKMPPSPRMFEILTPDKCEGHSLNIVSAEGQRMIEEWLQEGDVVILDNLSALGHAGDSKESEAESWWPVQEWALRLRKRGITVIFLHHAGKKGEQRGTSAREDLMHTVIAMRRPSDYSQAEGLRAEIHFEKLRKYGGPEAVYPFELRMETDHRGAVIWTQRPLKDLIDERVREMTLAGMKAAEIADDVHLSRFQVYRIQTKLGIRAGR